MGRTIRGLAKKWIFGRCPGFAGRWRYLGTWTYFPRKSVLFDSVCEKGLFEADIVHFMTRFARPRTTVFDVGANIGLMAIPVLNACESCEVVSFEPSPNSLPYLRRTALESRAGPRWKIIGKALSDQAGELDFHVGDPRHAAFDGFKRSSYSGESSAIRVPVSTLDAEWRELRKPTVSLIKIDVEGAEGNVIEGAKELLRTCRPHIILEWHEDYLRRFHTFPEKILSVAEENGYAIYTIPAGLLVSDARSLSIQMTLCSNFMLVP